MRRIFSYLLFTLLLFIFIFNNKIVINSVVNSFNIFYRSILFNIYPFIVLSDMLVNYGYFNIFKNVHLRSFNLLVMSVLCPIPSNALVIGNLYRKELINKVDAISLLSFSSFPNVIYVIYFIGKVVFNSYFYGFLLYFSIFISNIIMYIINYKNLPFLNISNKTISFNLALKKSLIDNFNNMIIIFGSISLFNLLIDIIYHYTNINQLFLAILNGFLELSSAFYKLSSINASLLFKMAFSSFILGFGSLSVLMQQLSVLDIKEIDSRKIIKNKIFVGIISSLISCLIYYFINSF